MLKNCATSSINSMEASHVDGGIRTKIENEATFVRGHKTPVSSDNSRQLHFQFLASPYLVIEKYS